MVRLIPQTLYDLCEYVINITMEIDN